MKALLTSGGLRNKTLIEALLSLIGKPKKSFKLVYISTAANVEEGDKGWMIDNLVQFKELAAEVDVINLEALKKSRLQKRLEWAEVIIVGGGNTYYLLDQARKSGLDKMLQELLKSRVYVGISAGSIIMTPSIDVSGIDDGDKNEVGIENTKGLGLIDFEVSPHTPDSVYVAANEVYSKTIKSKLIAYDDEMAVKIDSGQIEMVGEGKYWEYNK